MRKRFQSYVILALLSLSLFLNLGSIPSAYSWTPLEGRVTNDMTLSLAMSPYRIVKNVLVYPGVTLTIEPGVIIQIADDFSLTINGTLNAVGTPEQKIVFTSSRPDPSPGSWNSILFNGAPNESFNLKNAVISFATNGLTISTRGGRTVIEKSEIRDNSESGIKLLDKGDVLIKENNVTRNRNGISWEAATIRGGTATEVADLTIVGNHIFSNKENGLRVQDRNIDIVKNTTVSNNEFYSNGLDGIRLLSRTKLYNLTINGNNATQNGLMGIYLSSDTIQNVTVSENHMHLNKQAGLQLGASNYVLDSIILSNSARLNGKDGVHITASNGMARVLIPKNVLSRNGGAGLYLEGEHRNNTKFDAAVFHNLIVANDAGFSIYGSLRSNLTGNSISYNKIGLRYYVNGSNLAKNNDIYYNGAGASITGNGPVDAQQNYWGNITGPYHPSINPEGTGNSVNGTGLDMDFIPFQLTPNDRIQQPPTANLKASQTYVEAGQNITLYGLGSAEDRSIYRYYFDFGDLKNSGWLTSPVTQHKYVTPSRYNVSLKVEDDLGITSTNIATLTITVLKEIPPLTVSLTVSPDTMVSKGNATVTAHVTAKAKPVPNISVIFDLNKRWGTLSQVNGTTDANGNLNVTYNAPSVVRRLPVNIWATAFALGFENGSSYSYLQVMPMGGKLVITLSAESSSVESGQQTPLIVRVTDENRPVTNATVTLTAPRGGSLSTTKGITNSTGYLTTLFTAPSVNKEKTLIINASAAKTGNLDGSSQIEVAVHPEQEITTSTTTTTTQPVKEDPNYSVIAPIAIVAVALVAVVLLLRRRITGKKIKHSSDRSDTASKSSDRQSTSKPK